MFAPAYYRERLSSLPQVAVEAGDYSIIKSTSAFRERLLELIQQASHRIYITALYLEADTAGEQVLRALLEAKQARPELDIHIFVDFHRAQRGRIGEKAAQTNRDFYQRICAEYQHPVCIHGVPVKNREVFGVLHLKGFVFDDTVLYSGASINDVYLHQAERYRYDRYHEICSQSLSDSFVRFADDHLRENPAVKPLNDAENCQHKKIKPAIRRSRRILRNAEYEYAPDHVDGQIGLTPLCGIGARGNRLNRAISDLVRSTERELFICTPYFNMPRSLSRDINGLLKRGIKVTIVVGDKTANDFYIAPDQPFSTIGGLPYLYEHNLRSFARRHQDDIDSGLLNLMLWKHSDNSYHLKGLYADGKRAMITGSNLNPRAWGLDLENGILVQDNGQQLQAEFEHEQTLILANARRIDNYRQLEKVRDYPVEVQQLLKRIRRLKVQVLIKKII
ncbi:CDP-diacylglycerol--serine O-phosphatidyltransferase [Endozoicomonadaceae bacterium StTr2]